MTGTASKPPPTELTSRIRHLDRIPALLIAAIFMCLWLFAARTFPGFLKGDEVELLESALRWIGYSSAEPWPIRHSFLGEIVVGGWLSLWPVEPGPMEILLLVTIPAIVGCGIALLLTSRLARAITDRPVAGLAMILYGLHWVPLTYGTAPFPRPLTTPLLIGSCLLALSARNRWPHAFVAGLLVGAAGISRYSEWIYIVPLVVLLRMERNHVRTVISAAGGFIVAVVLVAAYDVHSWGAPGASLIAFIEYTLVESRSSSLEPHQPWYWYLGRFHQILAPPLWVFLWLGFRDERARRVILAFVLLPLVILSLVHHKEVRYLQAVIPILAACVACGVWIGLTGAKKRLYATLLVLGLVWSVVQFREISKRPSEPLEAARLLASKDPECVALMQPWRYGHTLFFPSARVEEIPMDASPASLVKQVSRCGYAAVYDDALPLNAENELRRRGIDVVARFPMERISPIVVLGRRSSTETPLDAPPPP